MEISDISFHHYTLKPLSAPNRLSSAQERAGSLVKIKFNGLKEVGYADLFPWPELGDEDILEQRTALKREIPYRLGAASIMWAYYEAKAASAGKSLVNGDGFKSHVTSNDRSLKNEPSLVKLKITQQDVTDWLPLQTWMQQYPTTKWRLDFNALFADKQSAEIFWSQVSPEIKAQVDFLEDPFVSELMHNKSARAVFGTTQIAADRCRPSDDDIWVIKPVYYSPDQLFSETEDFPGPIVITSNMDHPLGQLIALHTCQKISQSLGEQVLTAGLLTQGMYEQHSASHWVKTENDKLIPHFTGPGWGCRDQLAALQWSET